MSQQAISLLTLSLVATGVIAANRLVTAVVAQAGADAVTIGVANTAAAIGDRIPVTVKGTAVVESGAAVTVGATLKADASGRAITWVASGGKVGIALDAASGAGQFIEVLLLDNA